MYMVIDMLYDNAVFFGKEQECRRRAEYENSRANCERYTYTRETDYSIAI